MTYHTQISPTSLTCSRPVFSISADTLNTKPGEKEIPKLNLLRVIGLREGEKKRRIKPRRVFFYFAKNTIILHRNTNRTRMQRDLADKSGGSTQKT